MWSLVRVLLIILALTVTPLHCLGEAAVRQASSVETPRTCPCCHHEPESADPASNRSTPDDDEPASCINCLCQGATLESQRTAEYDFGIGLTYYLPLLHDVANIEHRIHADLDPSPPRAAGHALCILQRSLLI